MFKRPFTCVFFRGSTHAAAVIEAPTGSESAYQVAQEQLPGAKIIAMIPGIHAAHMYTYNETRTYVPPSGSLEPWPDNLPPGF